MSAPQKSERPGPAGRIAEGSTDNTGILTLGDQLRKALATLQAKFARLGHTLTYTIRDDGHITLIVGRWGQHRVFDRLSDVEAFLVQIGGRP